MSVQPQDGARRILALATRGLPAHRAAWGEAMRAELASIDDPEQRRRFARSAGGAAFARGTGIRLGLGLLTGALIAVTTLAASRSQLDAGGPGVLAVTVPVPALLILIAALVSAALMRSFRAGAATGLVAFASGFAGMFGVLAVEGTVWMDRHGVFLLDGDPPLGPLGKADIVLDIFTTGMWLGHVLLWLPAVVVGAGLGSWLSARVQPTRAPRTRS